MSKYHKGLIYIILSAMGFGIMPIFAKFAYEGGISPSTLLALRFIISGGLLFFYLRISGTSAKVTKKELIYLFLLGGVFYSATSIFYFTSIKFIPTALTVLLMYTHPMMVAILSSVFDKEKVTFKMCLAMGVAFIGLILILGNSFATRINGIGILLAMASAVSYSIYIFISSRVVKGVASIVATSYISIFAFIGMLGIGLFQREISFNFNPTVVLPLAALVFISTILAILFFLRGIEALGPTRATIISMFEPVFAAVFSMVIFSEALTLLQYIGGMAVLSGAIMVIIMKNEGIAVSGEKGLV